MSSPNASLASQMALKCWPRMTIIINLLWLWLLEGVDMSIIKKPLQQVMRSAVLGLALACAIPAQAGLFDDMFSSSSSSSKRDSFRLSKKDAANYEEAGKWWGERHRGDPKDPKKRPTLPGDTSDSPFIDTLIDRDEGGLAFFWAHDELKEAFKKGYRLGYQDRTADLVLGPYLTKAAAKIGNDSARIFVEVVQTFEENWAKRLRFAVDVFVTLISEGSQADREEFIANFEKVYDEKYKKTQADLKAGGFVMQTSEGGTTLFLDARNTKAVLDIPSTKVLKTEIYRQTFKVMGDEWGKRFNHNLVKREGLIDLLRRSKTALQEVSPGLGGNLAIIRESFEASYGTDAANVFRSLGKEAGYDDATLAASAPSQIVITPSSSAASSSRPALNESGVTTPARKRK